MAQLKTDLQKELEKLEESSAAVSLWNVPFLCWYECYLDGHLRIFDICSAFNCYSIGEMLVGDMKPVAEISATAVAGAYTHVNYGCVNAEPGVDAMSMDNFVTTFAAFHGLRVAAKLWALRVNDPNMEVINRLFLARLQEG